ncbi:phosphoribosyl 1,2-cyclic phosphate phosphodiesterase [Anaplasma platys]|uniref:Phosphoribosyl 1,2-cyclic phosphate phosphodiesterase n=1 Tax=Anaplasma platys TaxID=949 RepID=A0A858PYX0_9RICK|nr:MBL fold metallo-hydrolase [Anaplasma platys]QJC27816.1 phosphoribosyl 1,2-cyclic phosphate phosphodiesterase [Anaplasma platys]
MKITVLGCGSSVGVPSVGCDCRVCCSSDSRNKRTRTSALIEKGQTRILIDASPDLRQQALQQDFCAMDAVLFTHCHADHSSGISELQAFVPKSGHVIPVYSDFGTMALLVSGHAYLFIPSKPGAPWKKCHYLIANPVRHNVEFRIGEFGIVAIKQCHGEINSNGFIFDDAVAYCTDVKGFPSESWEMLSKKKVLILGCLRYQEVGAHAHVDLCVEWIKELRPEIAVLTHMSHDIDYQEITEYLRGKLPNQKTVVAYDGLELSL